MKKKKGGYTKLFGACFYFSGKKWLRAKNNPKVIFRSPVHQTEILRRSMPAYASGLGLGSAWVQDEGQGRGL